MAALGFFVALASVAPVLGAASFAGDGAAASLVELSALSLVDAGVAVRRRLLGARVAAVGLVEAAAPEGHADRLEHLLDGHRGPVTGCVVSVSVGSSNDCWTSIVSPVSTNLYTYVGTSPKKIPVGPTSGRTGGGRKRCQSPAASPMVRAMQVSSAVIPAAGAGTRFLPATKAVPKELMPIGDTPAIQLIIDEALGAGVDHIVVVSAGPNRRSSATSSATEVIEVLRRRATTTPPTGSPASAATGGSRSRTRTTARARPRRRVRPRGGRRPAVRGAAARRADGRLRRCSPR